MRSSTARRLEIPHLALILSVLVLAVAASGLRAQTNEPGAGSEAASASAPGSATSPGTGVAATAADDEVTPTLKGKHARRAARIGEWIGMLKLDRRRIYDQHGFPTYRHYELEFDTRTEHWFYLAENREFVFSGDRLIGQQ